LTTKDDEQARRALHAAPRTASRHFNRTAARQALKPAMKTELGLTPSLSQIARELGASYQLLRYHFPDLARNICLPHRAGQQAQQAS
jgi:AraC-like DNA-binding protein